MKRMTSLLTTLIALWRLISTKRVTGGDIRCPSEEYQYCAKDFESCSIPSTVKSGYISYGVSNAYILTAFTNDINSNLVFTCGPSFGDPLWGIVKYCCYPKKSMDIAGNFAVE